MTAEPCTHLHKKATGEYDEENNAIFKCKFCGSTFLYPAHIDENVMLHGSGKNRRQRGKGMDLSVMKRVKPKGKVTYK